MRDFRIRRPPERGRDRPRALKLKEISYIHAEGYTAGEMKHDQEMTRGTNHALVVPATAELLAPLVTAIPLQLLVDHIGVLSGCDVDQPRNIAKSVTVE